MTRDRACESCTHPFLSLLSFVCLDYRLTNEGSALAVKYTLTVGQSSTQRPSHVHSGSEQVSCSGNERLYRFPFVNAPQQNGVTEDRGCKSAVCASRPRKYWDYAGIYFSIYKLPVTRSDLVQ